MADIPVSDVSRSGPASGELPLRLEPDPVVEHARTGFNVPYVYPYQRFVIANTLEKKDQIVILPTGAGKSLCFQLPAAFLEGPTLVVYPLLSLISDQKRRLTDAGLNPGVLMGGQTPAEREELFRRCRDRELKIVLTNPETLLSPRVHPLVAGLGFSHVVIDEAHCVSEWGDTFRPSYLELGSLVEEFAESVVTAFTATASDAVVRRIADVLFRNRSWQLVRADADRPNIFYRVVECESKSRSLLELTRSEEKPLLVFTRSRKEAEMTAFFLRRRTGGRNVLFYHAGLSREEKAAVEKSFYDSKDGVLCSTSAYGMGVDKKNIRTVIHTHVAPSVESYLQESGRAGRDGLSSRAILLHAIDDRLHVRLLTREIDLLRYKRMLSYVYAATCRREYLLSLLGQEPCHCSGCDVCTEPPSARAGNHGPGRKLIRFVSRYPGKFTARETASILSGQRSLSMLESGATHLSEYGSCPEWDREDLLEVVRNLISRKEIAEHRRRCDFLGKKMYLYVGRVKKRLPGDKRITRQPSIR